MAGMLVDPVVISSLGEPQELLVELPDEVGKDWVSGS